MTKQEFIEWIEKQSKWKKDRWGHYKKEIKGKIFRFKIQAQSVRLEQKWEHGWFKIKSNYYKSLSIVDDKLKGLKR